MNLELRTVTAVDPEQRKVKTKDKRTGTQGGWLSVLQWDGAELELLSDGYTPHVHETGGEKSTTGVWLPKVNDTVLVAYLPVPQGDGYVLGRVS